MKHALALALIALLAVHSSQAQDPPRKVILAGENDQVLPRLLAADRLVAWGTSPESAVRTVGLAGLTNGPHRLIGPCLAMALENNSREDWEKAFDEYQRLLLEEGEWLVPPPARTDAAQATSPAVRRVIQQRLAMLPPPLRKVYRQRVDAEAKKLLDEAKEQRSPRPLRRLIDELFCSRYGDQALDLLGDLAFEAGRFEEALRWWGHIVMPPGETASADSLLFPDPRVDPALIQAKQILALGFLGRDAQARKALSLWRKDYPNARGQLAGERGALAAIVSAALDKLSQREAIPTDEAWSTFGGDFARNHAIARCPPARLWVDGPTWRLPLPGPERRPHDRRPIPESLAYHPVIARGQVLLTDEHSITGYALQTGKETFRYAIPVHPGDQAKTKREGQFTLTVWENLAFARLGRLALANNNVAEKEEKLPPSYLVCIDVDSVAGGKAKKVWQIEAPTLDGAPSVFEGAPVIHEGKVITAVSRLHGDRTVTALICLDIATGRQRWLREVCEAQEADDQPGERMRPHLLTLTPGQVVYCNHAGAVVAVDPWTGQRLWGLRYSGNDSSTAGGPSPRGETGPCVYGDGRLFVAPSDCRRLFCLDPDTGRLIWDRDGVEVIHLLGVARDRLVFTTAGKLRAVSAADGADLWQLPNVGTLRGLGRGLIMGDWIFWPTQDNRLPYRAIDLESGTQERAPGSKGVGPDFFDPTLLRSLAPGNMAFGQDCLVIAGLDELVCYVPARLQLKEREEAFLGKPAAQALHRLAVAELDAGHAQKAKELWTKLKSVAAWDRYGWWRERAGLELAKLDGQAHNPWQFDVTPLVKDDTSFDAYLQKQVELRFPLERVVDPSDAALPAQVRRASQSGFLAELGGIAVSAGPAEIKGASREGAPGWRFAAAAPRLAWQERNGTLDYFHEPLEGLSGFQFNRRLLYFLRDQRCLIALDPVTGKPVWRQWAPDAKLRLADGGVFCPRFHAGDRFLLAQTAAGKLVVFDSLTGAQLRESPTTREPWPQAPLSLGNERFAIAEDAGRVRMFDASNGKTLWTYTPQGRSNLTGSAPQMLLHGNVIIALIDRNTGRDLVCLEARSGLPLWTVSLKSDADLRGASIDDDAVYLVFADRLRALALATGKLVWEKPLTATGRSWRSLRTGRALVVYPMDCGLPWLPLGDSAIAWAGAVRMEAARMGMAGQRQRSIEIREAKDGLLLQRLWLPAGVGAVTVRILPGYLIAVTDGPGGDCQAAIFREAQQN